jgi:hypothetical protein
MNSPSSSFSSSCGRDLGFRAGMIGMGSKSRFSGLISLLGLPQSVAEDGQEGRALCEHEPMHDTTLFMEIPDSMSDLDDYVSSEIFREIGELDDLVEKFPAFAVKRGHFQFFPNVEYTGGWGGGSIQEFENEEIVLPRLDKRQELDDSIVAEVTHDLHFLEDVGALLGGKKKEKDLI